MALWSCTYNETVSQGWDVTKARGQVRSADFSTDEGTWMSLDISPDGKWIVFDLVAHIYRVPATGGEAQCLTCDSGLSINMHPRYSPDGNTIAFISDRDGQDNLWRMAADGTNARAVYLDQGTRVYEPAWSSDSRAIVATRHFPDVAGFYHPRMEIWKFPLDGSEPTVLARSKTARYRWPSLGPGDRNLYYFTSYPSWSAMGVYVGQFIHELDLQSSQARFLRSHPDLAVDPEVNPYAPGVKAGSFLASIPGIGAAELAPEASPDGRYLAFVTRNLGDALRIGDRAYGPTNALILRDLATGTERVIADPISFDLARIDASYSIKVVPGFAWAKDSRSLVFTEGGKIRRVYVEDSRIETIPFTARVRRELSESPRSRVTLDDDRERVQAILWPSGSPDGQKAAFVAVGRLWVTDLREGKPAAIVPVENGTIHLTPAWSPDGTRIAFTTWNDEKGGDVWTVAPDGNELKQVTRERGQYAHPAWSRDGKDLIVAQGPGVAPPEEWVGWDAQGQWKLVSISVSSGSANDIAHVVHETQPHLAADDRIFFYEDSADAMLVRSVSRDGGTPRVHARFPHLTTHANPVPHRGNLPLMSPGGDYVAFEAASSIYVNPIAVPSSEPAVVSNDPNAAAPERIRIGAKGGIFPRWRDPDTVEFVSGPMYVTYNVRNGESREHPIELDVPRATTAPGSVALLNAKIVTADHNDTVFERGDIVVRNGRIACIGRCDSSMVDRAIDIDGKFVIPGIVDTHAHVSPRVSRVNTLHQPEHAAYLAYGVTTTVDPYPFQAASHFPVAEMIEAGLVTGPRAFSTGEAVIGWNGWSIGADHLEIEDYADAKFLVGQRLRWGAISAKNYRLNRRDQQQMLMEAAREHGVTVTAEGKALFQNIAAVLDGQTGWEHWVSPLVLRRDITEFYGQARSVYAPTLAICGHPVGAVHYHRARSDLSNDRKYGRFMPRADTNARVEANVPVSDREYAVPIVAEGVRGIVRAGGHAALGAHGEQPGVGAHWDLWSFAEAFTPLESIRIASHGGAYFHGLDHELGSLEAGKLADLLVLNADPLLDIRNTLSIEYVMKSGKIHDGDSLDVIWPQETRHAPSRQLQP